MGKSSGTNARPDTAGLGLATVPAATGADGGCASATAATAGPGAVVGPNFASPQPVAGRPLGATASRDVWIASTPLLGVPEGGEDVLGKRVVIQGLVQAPEFNGQWGKVETYDAGLQRYVVWVLPSCGPPVLAKLRRENFVVPAPLPLSFDDEIALTAFAE